MLKPRPKNKRVRRVASEGTACLVRYFLSVLADELEVPVHRTKTALIFLGALAFVFLGIAIIILPPKNAGDRPGSIVSGGLAVCFFGMCAVAAARRLLDRRPALVLTPDRLINSSSVAQIAEVPWSEVSGAEIIQFGRHRFLALWLKNAEAMLGKEKAPVRLIQGANKSLVGSPVVIAGSIIGISLEDLLHEVKKRIRRTGPEPVSAASGPD
jgi:hypothetical protein